MKRPVFLILLMLLLVGGGAGVWQFGKPLLDDLLPKDEPILKETLFVTLDPLVLPVIRNGHVVEHITLGLQLEVLGLDSEIRLRDNLPKLRDAFVTELYGLMGLRYVQEKRGQLPLVKERLQLVSDRVLGPGVVRNVLINGIDNRRDFNARG